MADYPGSLYTKTTVTDDVTDVLAAHHNDQEDEILAIETELGTDVAGSATDLKTRLAHSINAAGYLEFDDSAALTISGGAVTATQNFHRIATEGGAATDDLDTINGNSNGLVLFIRPSSSNDVVLKHNTGNIVCAAGADLTLEDTNDLAILVYDGTLTKWVAIKGAAGSSITTSTGAGNNYIAVYTASTNIEGTDNLQWDNTDLTIGDGTAGRDYGITFNGETNDGVLEWMEDEDYFKFSDGILMVDQEAIYFDSTDTYIAANTDDPEDLEIAADQDILLKADNQVVTDTVIRGASTLYRRYYHMDISAANPGAAGATFTPPDGNTIGGFQLDAAGELLYFGADVHSDWDGASDMTVEVSFEINAASSENDTVDIKLVCYYKGDAETVTKSQTLEEAVNVGDGGAKAQYTSFSVDFTIDYDALSNVVEVGDIFHFIMNLETDTSEVDDIIINAVSMHYNTTHIGIEAGDV